MRVSRGNGFRSIALFAMLILAAAWAISRRVKTASADSRLQIVYGDSGIEKLTYGNTVLEDRHAYPSDIFHIGHLEMTDLRGNKVSEGQYGWGENNQGHRWDVASRTWIYTYAWGSIRVQFDQSGDSLAVRVTQQNSSHSGVVLDGAVIYPFVLHFPMLPKEFAGEQESHLTYSTVEPPVTTADFGAGKVLVVQERAGSPLVSGLLATAGRAAYVPVMGGTSPDGVARSLPKIARPVRPGETDTFVVALRFASSGAPTAGLAQDVYRSWAERWPPVLHWADRRPIGSVYLASSPQGAANVPGGSSNNPRRYFQNAGAAMFDLRTAAGLRQFQKRVLDQALANTENMRRLGAQGAITWDIEGEEYPQATSYVCSPDSIAEEAPEMETLVLDKESPYFGMKLDDAYFRTMRDAGYRVGVCVRPQRFERHADGTASQVALPDDQVAAELLKKIKYARARWDATLFYVDSTVNPDGRVLDPGVFAGLAVALPDVLIVPEESTPRYYAYSAPLQTFLFHGDLGTEDRVRQVYPGAFSVNLVNDADPARLEQSSAKLVRSVREGDVLMGHVGYWQANDPMLVKIYQEATSGSRTAPRDGGIH